MLDIIITHYKEKWDVCRRLICTMAAQIGVNWDEVRVIMIHDGTKTFDELLEGWPFQVDQVVMPHGGVSAARNTGIELARQPWIMFCDCDDCFSNVYALADILNVLKSENADQYDMMWTNVWTEDDEGRVYQIQDKKIMVFIHGKVYRREFLLREDIRFDTCMKFNEDSLFNARIMVRTPSERIGHITTYAPAYTWIKRPGSVTDGATDEAAVGQFRRNLIIAKDIQERKPENYPGMVTRVVYDTFYMCHTARFSESCKQQIRGWFLDWIRTRREHFCKVDADMLYRIKLISRAELMGKDEILDDDPYRVFEWLDRVCR